MKNIFFLFAILILSTQAQARIASLKCQAVNAFGVAQLTYDQAENQITSVVNGGLMKITYNVIGIDPEKKAFSESSGSSLIMIQENEIFKGVMGRIFVLEFPTPIEKKKMTRISGSLVSYMVTGAGSVFGGEWYPVSRMPVSRVNCDILTNW